MLGLLFQQYYANFVMILIENIISIIILFYIFKIAYYPLLKEEQISQQKKRQSLLITLLIVFGLILGIRYIFALLGYFSLVFRLLNSLFIFFAVLSSFFYLIFWKFIKKHEKYKGTIKRNKKIKRGILIIGSSWITALIFLSIDILEIPLGDFLPSDIIIPNYDVFLLGFEWLFFVLIIDIYLTKIVNRMISVKKRVSKEILTNSILFGALISFGIWSTQLIIVELYLKRLFNIMLYEQDIRFLILIASLVYFFAFYISLRFRFLPRASKESLEKINETLRKQTEMGIVSEPIEQNGLVLNVMNLTTYFYTEEGTVHAVEGVNFKMYQGEVLGLVGETGCGKTVTALSILNLIRPPGKIIEGSVEFGGIDLTALDERDLLQYRGKDITMIFQDPLNSLNPVYKIGDQISEVILLHKEDELLQEVSKSGNESVLSVARRWTEDLLRDLNIPVPKAIYDRYPHELSGGMRQRVQIAIALACSPKLLIADEPTTALDVTIQNQILKLMKDLNANFNTSILFITHDLGIISKMCNRVAVMYSGYIVEYGDKKNLFEKPYHPYTRGLLASIPIEGKEGDLLIIPGMVPNLIYPPSGCRFHPRCTYCFEPCSSKVPELVEVEPNYFVSCHLYNSEYTPD